jgi:lysophospholipase L1-like esterase
MLQEIHDNFRACQSPEIYLARAAEKPVQSEEKKEQRVLLVGASNLKHSVPHFADATLTFANITTAGWIATAENVKNLITLINSRTQETDAFVFDLLGNSSIRFEQADGTTALPFKSNGRYHLGGDVVVTPPDIFTELVKRIIPLLKATGNKPSVIIPPLPRYLFARCCNDTEHCTNAAVPDFCKTLLSGFTEMRNSLIRQLVSSGLTNFRVMDICCTTECPVTACTEERIKGLRSVTAKDGVHFVDAGYRNMAGRCVDCLLKMLKKADDASSIQPGKSGSPTSFFWRGFRSPRGSSRFKKSHVWTPGIRGTARGRAVPARGRAKTPRGQLHQSSTSNYHPYRRW